MSNTDGIQYSKILAVVIASGLPGFQQEVLTRDGLQQKRISHLLHCASSEEQLTGL